MDEYISREGVLKKAKSSISVPTDNEWDCGYNTAMAEMQEFIKQLPSADVQPVKHGKWKYYRNNGIIDTYICTNCQGKVEMTIDVESSKFKYCPNCGARIDIIYEDDKIRAIKVIG